MSDSNEKEILFEQGAVWLAPGEAGSTIQWFVRVHTFDICHGKNEGKRTASFNGCVTLSDCERRISWSLWNVEKIDRAIAELKKVQKALRKAKKLHHEHKLTDEDDGLEEL